MGSGERTSGVAADLTNSWRPDQRQQFMQDWNNDETFRQLCEAAGEFHEELMVLKQVADRIIIIMIKHLFKHDSFFYSIADVVVRLILIC